MIWQTCLNRKAPSSILLQSSKVPNDQPDKPIRMLSMIQIFIWFNLVRLSKVL